MVDMLEKGQELTNGKAKAPGKRPVKKFRAGRLTVDLWGNVKDEQTWYSVTVQRSWQDQDGQWNQSTSLGRDDLLVVGELLRQAWNWIRVQQEQ